MKIGIKPGQLGAGLDQLWSLWRESEDSGFSSLWVFDHLTNVRGMMCPEALVCTALMAACTESIPIGTMVLNTQLRPPGLVANAAASIHQFTQGRLVVGLGAGSNFARVDHQQLGIEFPSFERRLRRLEEYCQVLRELWSGNVATFQGQSFRLATASLGKPVDFSIPIAIGGGSPQVLATAARHAQIWNFVTRFPKVWAQKADQLKALCKEQGKEVPTLTVQLFLNETLHDLETRLELFALAGAQEAILVFDPSPKPGEARALARRLRLDQAHRGEWRG